MRYFFTNRPRWLYYVDLPVFEWVTTQYYFDLYATADIYAFVADLPNVHETVLDEHSGALRLFYDASDITEAYCFQQDILASIYAHLNVPLCDAWSEFIATLEFAPIDEHATKPLPPIDDEVTR